MYNSLNSPAQFADVAYTRTADECELETILTFITLNLPQCEVDDFHTSQDAMTALAGDDHNLATYLQLVDARQWARSLTGRDWQA